MKARDLVPGWPRGRSTAGPWHEWDPLWMFLWFDESDLAWDEARANRAYHASQQRMVDEWRCGSNCFVVFGRECESGLFAVIEVAR